MKNTLKILAIILAVAMAQLGCASPLPETPIVLSWDASPDAASGIVTSYNIYQLRATDTDWVLLTNVPSATLTVVLVQPKYGTRYCCTAVGQIGQESPMSNVVTNNNLAGMGGMKISR